MADPVNHYEVLGLSRNASQDEIRASYRRLAKERHPDHPSGSARSFAMLQEAHATLSDPERRKQYDQELDLAYAADQLSDLDFSSLEDELAAKRRERDSEPSRPEGPGLGERLRGRFGRGNDGEQDRGRGGRGRSNRDDVRRRGRYEIREARWYEPHHFDYEPIDLKSGAICFVAAFVAFLVVGQIGLWATGAANPGAFVWVTSLDPFMPVLYLVFGLLAAYFAFRSIGYWGLALVFIAALVVGGQGGTDGLLQFATVGIIVLLAVIYLGTRREQTARR